MKTVLGKEHLRCKTPDMADKELWGRQPDQSAEGASRVLADLIPRQISFKHSVQIWLAWQQQGG